MSEPDHDGPWPEIFAFMTRTPEGKEFMPFVRTDDGITSVMVAGSRKGMAKLEPFMELYRQRYPNEDTFIARFVRDLREGAP